MRPDNGSKRFPLGISKIKSIKHKVVDAAVSSYRQISLMTIRINCDFVKSTCWCCALCAQPSLVVLMYQLFQSFVRAQLMGA